LLAQDIGALAEGIAAYRAARRRAGFTPSSGIVSVMLHTFIGATVDAVRAAAYLPLREYLRSAVNLERRSAAAGGTISGGKRLDDPGRPSAEDDEMLDMACERYFRTAALLGTRESCAEIVLALEEIGVDEIACLIDFGIEDGATLDGL